MNVMEAIQTRRSIRAYKSDPVSAEVLNKVLECARIAPSASNRQPWKFVVARLDSEAKKVQWTEALRNQKFVPEVPVVIACCAPDPTAKWHPVDVAIATDHMTLAAWELGLGTCWIGAFEEDKVKALIGAPAEVKVVCCLTLGYPAAVGVDRGRKAAEEVISFEKY